MRSVYRVGWNHWTSLIKLFEVNAAWHNHVNLLKLANFKKSPFIINQKQKNKKNQRNKQQAIILSHSVKYAFFDIKYSTYQSHLCTVFFLFRIKFWSETRKICSLILLNIFMFENKHFFSTFFLFDYFTSFKNYSHLNFCNV